MAVVPLKGPDRKFTSANISSMRSDWPVWSSPPDADIRYGLSILRARARHEAQNNDHVRSFLRQVKSHLIGPDGVTLQCKAMTRSGKPDNRLRDAVEGSWKQWGEIGNCEVTGQLSWIDEQHRFAETVARDGEAVYRVVQGWEDNRWGFALQAIDPETLDVDYMEDLKNGHFIVMGVELNEWRRPVAYHFLQETPVSSMRATRATRKRVRVPAEEIIHCYLPEWVWQTRGVPWVATALKRLTDLGGYEESAIVAARAGASKMGFYEQSEEAMSLMNDDGTTNPGVLADGQVAPEGDMYQNFEPGSIGVLPPGYKFTGWNPQFPNWEHQNFVKAVLRGVAAGVGVNYNRLASDYEGVNYSSLREGNLSEQDLWKTVQNWAIGTFHTRVFRAWLNTSVAVGAIKAPTGRAAGFKDLEEMSRIRWQPRRWKWVDPSKEVAAAKTEVDMGSRSLSSVIRERGADPEEVWTEIAEERARMKELGVTVEETMTALAEPKPGEDDEDN